MPASTSRPMARTNVLLAFMVLVAIVSLGVVLRSPLAFGLLACLAQNEFLDKKARWLQ